MNLSERFPNASHAFLQLNRKAPQPPVYDMTTLSESYKSATKPLKQKGRLRQNASGLNKLEQSFKEYLGVNLGPLVPILDQCITLKIANGCRYTPDFIARGQMGRLGAYEVKGFMRDDAAVKLKVAASLYPWIKFHLVSRKKGAWLIQEILP